MNHDAQAFMRCFGEQPRISLGAQLARYFGQFFREIRGAAHHSAL